ncbi:heme-binding protein 2-like [Ciona intestinalis]
MGNQPSFESGQYNGYQQPEFVLADNQPEDESYQVRHYRKAKWTSTKTTSEDHYGAGRSAFRSLFNYIRGENATSDKISMTVPVTIQKPEEGKSDFVTSFYVPTDHQNSPPEPSNPNVFTQTRDDVTIYARVFSGFAKEADYQREIKALRSDLQRYGVTEEMTDNSTYVCASYDSPFRLLNRRNEVWVIGSSLENVGCEQTTE